MHSFNSLDWFRVGAGTPTTGMIVSTDRLGLLRAYGIVSDRMVDGKPCVIAGSIRSGRICEHRWEQFSRGSGVSIEPCSGAFPEESVRRARLLVGARYNALTWRGEHALGHDLELKSVGILVIALLTVLHAVNVL